MRRFVVRYWAWLNDFSQVPQLCLFSPLLVEICLWRVEAIVKDFPQAPHVWLFDTISEKMILQISLKIWSLVERLLTGSTLVCHLATMSEKMSLKSWGCIEWRLTGHYYKCVFRCLIDLNDFSQIWHLNEFSSLCTRLCFVSLLLCLKSFLYTDELCICCVPTCVY